MKHINIDIQNVYEYGHDNSPIHMVVPTVPPWNESTYLFKPHWLQYPARVKTSIVEFGSATAQLAKKEFALFESIVDKDIFCFAKYNIFLGYGLGTHAGEVISAYDLQGYRCDNGFTFTLGNHFNNRAIATGGEVKQLGKELEYLLSFVELANAFAHCKNVELIDQPLTRQQRRRKERKGETFYKVLAIEPFNKQKRNVNSGSSGNEADRRLHICRGHFATYTEDKPLFGKYAGTFWIPMHVRGNKAAGEIVKDYKIDMDENS